MAIKKNAVSVNDEDISARSRVSPAVIKRLPRYYRYLRELLQNDILRISSGELSKLMHVTASQIRQDLNCFGGFGQQGYGYNVKYLYGKIGEILGVTQHYKAIIIGAGNLGSALAASPIFERRGVKLTALFDSSPAVVGRTISGYTVRAIDELEAYIRENKVDIAVLTLTKDAVRDMAEHLAGLGVKGLWNFASTELNLSNKDVVVQNVHMGDSLMRLCYQLTK
ncbi:MAG: redox-sensing transcriptional repressor Rex [Clostridia bacterium]|nr:redox-sensing transcriptional repressor Rex [Clostridia bacterium]MBQ6796504.1 redox-sensing transcriptional repressor Rex [Clostridia bacterium]